MLFTLPVSRGERYGLNRGGASDGSDDEGRPLSPSHLVLSEVEGQRRRAVSRGSISPYRFKLITGDQQAKETGSPILSRRIRSLPPASCVHLDPAGLLA